MPGREQVCDGLISKLAGYQPPRKRIPSQGSGLWVSLDRQSES